MYYLLACLIGALGPLMNMCSNLCSQAFGTFTALILNHVIGLLVAVFGLLVFRKRLVFRRDIPVALYLGGAVGVCNVLFNLLAWPYLSVSFILALQLFGQTVTSLAVDTLGWFGYPKQAFQKKKLFPLALILVGTLLMALS